MKYTPYWLIGFVIGLWISMIVVGFAIDENRKETRMLKERLTELEEVIEKWEVEE